MKVTRLMKGIGTLGTLGALGLAVLAGPASAAAPAVGTTCSNTSKIDGRGATFATAAWGTFAAAFRDEVCGPVTSAPADAAADAMVTYNGAWATVGGTAYTGSGRGLEAATCRSTAFSGTDVPYTAAQLGDLRGAPGTMTNINPTGSCANRHGTANGGTGGVSNLIQPPFANVTNPVGGPVPWPNAADTTSPIMSYPVAGSSVVPAVNLSGAGCTPAVTSLQFTSAMVDGLFDGTIKTWADPALRAGGVNPGLANCTGSIARVVRQDNSGTTQVFKNYLAKVDPALNAAGCATNAGFDWTTLRNAPSPNTGWPGGGAAGTGGTPTAIAVGAAVPANPNANCSPVVSATASGATNLRAVLDQAGFSGIGYLDLADTVAGVNLIKPSVRNAADTGYIAPNVATRANCNFSTVSAPAGTPDGAVGLDAADTWAFDQAVNNRSDVTFTGTGYPICGLTFALVYTGMNSSAVANPVTALTDPQRRTLYSFMSYALSSAGQDKLTTNNYARLPVTLVGTIRSGFQANF